MLINYVAQAKIDPSEGCILACVMFVLKFNSVESETSVIVSFFLRNTTASQQRQFQNINYILFFNMTPTRFI